VGAGCDGRDDDDDDDDVVADDEFIRSIEFSSFRTG
jgi:hypothetical protein